MTADFHPAASGPAGNGGRMAHIDAMRALAAMAVAFFHYYGGNSGDDAHSSPVQAAVLWLVQGIDLGRSAVLLFFIISGYVVARSVAGPPDHNVLRFAVRRLCRLFPMFWVALALHVMWAGDYAAADLWQNALMVQIPGWPENPIVSVAWTMTIELVFYVLCAGLFVLGILKSPRWLGAVVAGCLAMAMVSALGRAHLGFHIPFEWPLFLSIMFAGALLRELDERKAVRPVQAVAFAALVLLPVILLLSVLVFWDESVHQKSWHRHFNAYAVAIGTFLLMHYGFRSRDRVLVYLGRISYSIYLLHPVAGAWVIAALGAAGVSAERGFLTVTCALGGTVVAAAVTYRMVEAPAIGFGRHLNSRLDRVSWRPRPDVEEARRIP